jgi:homoserine dehydrogenase
MKVQVVGLGNVGKSLLQLVANENEYLKFLGFDLKFVSVSDSSGTAVDKDGLNLNEVLKYKMNSWIGFKKYTKGYTALDAIKNIKGDVVVELTASTPTGEPGLSHVRAALSSKKYVVTANKGPLVVAYKELLQSAKDNDVKLLYEATVAVHVPIFCLLNSCFIADEVLKIEGILNATTNFIIGEIESGKTFQEALNIAIKAGWAELNYSDDVDGVDAARKVVILANSIYQRDFKIEDVKVLGIRNIEPMIREAVKLNKKAKLICEIRKEGDKIFMNVAPKIVSLDNPLATVNHGNMGIKFTFKTCQEVFTSAQFTSTTQTAYAVLNDILRVQKSGCSC